jgi:hypothetical protein
MLSAAEFFLFFNRLRKRAGTGTVPAITNNK